MSVGRVDYGELMAWLTPVEYERVYYLAYERPDAPAPRGGVLRKTEYGARGDLFGRLLAEKVEIKKLMAKLSFNERRIK